MCCPWNCSSCVFDIESWVTISWCEPHLCSVSSTTNISMQCKVNSRYPCIFFSLLNLFLPVQHLHLSFVIFLFMYFRCISHFNCNVCVRFGPFWWFTWKICNLPRRELWLCFVLAASFLFELFGVGHVFLLNGGDYDSVYICVYIWLYCTVLFQ